MFTLYDSLLFVGKPPPASWGGVPFTTVYQQFILSAGDTMPTQDDVAKRFAAYANSTDLICLDVETLKPTAPTRKEIGAQLIQLLAMVRIACPRAKLGYYGVVPIRDYWRANNSPSIASHDAWVLENEDYRTLADSVDALFPSLYTFYDDPTGWKSYARENIAVARKMAGSKPVLPFIWPQYHDSNVALHGQLIPGPAWRAQLDACRAFGCDGVVVWGGYTVQFDATADWYTQTQSFAATRVNPVNRTKAQNIMVSSLGARRSEIISQLQALAQTPISALQQELADINAQLVAIDPTIPVVTFP